MASLDRSRTPTAETAAAEYQAGEGERAVQSRRLSGHSAWSFQLLRYVDDVAILVSSSNRMAAIRAAAAEAHRWYAQFCRPWPSTGRGLEHRIDSPPYDDGSTTAGSDTSEGSDSERDLRGGAEKGAGPGQQ